MKRLRRRSSYQTEHQIRLVQHHDRSGTFCLCLCLYIYLCLTVSVQNLKEDNCNFWDRYVTIGSIAHLAQFTSLRLSIF